MRMSASGDRSHQLTDARGARRRGEGRRARACVVGLRVEGSTGERAGERAAASEAPRRELLASGAPGHALRGVPVRGGVLPPRRLDPGGLRRDGAGQHRRRRGRAAVGRGARAGDHGSRPGGHPRGADGPCGDAARRASAAGRGEAGGVVYVRADLRDRVEPAGRARDACASPAGAVVAARHSHAGGRDPRGVRVRRRSGRRPCAVGRVRAALVRPVGGRGAVRRDVSHGRGSTTRGCATRGDAR